jgi:[phosphatase 2A protein]-leucine-carboxy methyltransferase
VRSTDDDAAASRLSCAELGYIDDPFATAFVTAPAARPPLINIGTHARTWAMDVVVHGFLNSQPSRPKQIVSLGAGTDTRFFKLHRDGLRGPNLRRYVEIDFAESTSKKARIVKGHPAFASALGPDAVLSEHTQRVCKAF